MLEIEPMKLTTKNLYSYCDNNPVSKADSNGEIATILGKAAIGACINVAVTWASAGITGDELSVSDVIVAAMSGAVSTVSFIEKLKISGSVLSMVIDCVYIAMSDGIEEAGENFLLSSFMPSVIAEGFGVGDALELLLDTYAGWFFDYAISKNTNGTNPANSNRGYSREEYWAKSEVDYWVNDPRRTAHMDEWCF